MATLEERFRSDGFDEPYICKYILRKKGLYLKPDYITFQVKELDKGMQIRSRIYELVVLRARDSKVISNFIIKDYSSSRDSVVDFFPGNNLSKKRKDISYYEAKFIRFFQYQKDNLLVHHIGRNKRLILEKWNGSLDELIFSSMNSENNLDIETLYHMFMSMLWNDLKRATELKYFLSFGKSRPFKKNENELLIRYKIFVEEISKFLGLHNTNINDSIASEINKLVDYTTCKNRVEAVIHSDARSANVLYKWRPPRSIDRSNLILADFESIKLGPISYSLATAANDIYFLCHYKDSPEKRKIIFDEMMMRDPSLWTPEKKDHELKEQLDHEYLYGTILQTLKTVGLSLLFRKNAPEKHARYITQRPYETIESMVENKLRSFSDAVMKFDGKKEFSTLAALFKLAQ